MTKQEKFELFLTIILIIGSIIFFGIPEFKKSLGSSDKIISHDENSGIVEIKIDNKTNFSLITKENNITGILFYDKSSLYLYNKDIENNTLDEGINKIIDILVKNNILTNISSITFIKYDDKSFTKVIDLFNKNLNKLNIPFNYNTLELTLLDKVKSLNIEIEDETNLIRYLDLYSKELIRHYKNSNNDFINQNQNNSNLDDYSKELANNVYIKIENYKDKNNVMNQDMNNMTLPINLIPADTAGNIYSNTNSWYYIKEGKVYAYINITLDDKYYDYCYQGSIDIYKKGQC